MGGFAGIVDEFVEQHGEENIMQHVGRVIMIGARTCTLVSLPLSAVHPSPCTIPNTPDTRAAGNGADVGDDDDSGRRGGAGGGGAGQQ